MTQDNIQPDYPSSSSHKFNSKLISKSSMLSNQSNHQSNLFSNHQSNGFQNQLPNSSSNQLLASKSQRLLENPFEDDLSMFTSSQLHHHQLHNSRPDRIDKLIEKVHSSTNQEFDTQFKKSFKALTGEGFNAEQVLKALSISKNDKNVAKEYILKQIASKND